MIIFTIVFENIDKIFQRIKDYVEVSDNEPMLFHSNYKDVMEVSVFPSNCKLMTSRNKF